MGSVEYTKLCEIHNLLKDVEINLNVYLPAILAELRKMNETMK